MWLLFLYTIVNAVTSGKGFQNVYRISLGGIELGVLEGMVGLGLLVAILMGARTKSQTPTDRTHPAYVICMILLIAGFVFGVVGSLLHDAIPHYKMVFIREYFGMPASVFIGYQLTGTLRKARKFSYAIIIAGVAVSIFMMAAFGRGAERYELKGDWGALRTTNFITNYAGVASGLLIFSVLAGLKLMPVPLALALAGFCFIGQLTPLHRSDWLAQAAAIMAIPLCLPAGARIRQSLRLVLAIAALGMSLWAGLHVASAITGRNFHKTFEDRLISMLPGERLKSSDQKAWDTRLPAMQMEIQMWLSNPVMGRGFAFEESLGLEGAARVGFGYHHNAYTSTLAQTGLVGFIGVVMAVWCPIFLGYRMVRQQFDRGSVIIGALGIIAGVQQAVLGMATASFNGYRMSMLIGLVSGIVFRVREMQLTGMRLTQEYGAPIGIDVEPMPNQPAAQGFDVLPDIPEFDDQGRPISFPPPGYAEYPSYS
jgi:hypothetical protein